MNKPAAQTAAPARPAPRQSSAASSRPSPQAAPAARTVPRPAPAQPKAASPSTARPRPAKKNWPLLEVVVVLLLIKISIGAWYLWSGSRADTRAAAPPAPAAGLVVEETAPSVSAVKPAPASGAPAREASKVDGYLAAAVGVTGPSVAQAAPAESLPAATASLSTATAASTAALVSPISAGAYMVIGAQAGTGSATQASPPPDIPLPPDADLLTPAVHLPTPSLPTLGDETRDVAPLPPSVPVRAPQEAEAMRVLRDREQDLARREADLSTRQEALTALEAELRRRAEDNEAFRSENEALLRRNEAILAEMKALREEQKKEDDENKKKRILHLVTAYKGMKAEQAGTLVNSLDDDVAVDILSAMPGRNAGLILAYVNPDKAARLTKAIAERRLDPTLLLGDNLDQAAGAPAPAEP